MRHGGGQIGAWRRQADQALALKAHQLQQASDALRAEIIERRRTQQALQEAQAELARAARLTAMGEVTATIAHEINQPLAAISNNAGACIRWLNADPPDLIEARLSANCIVRDSARAAAVVSRVRAMVRHAMPDKTSISINRVIEDVLSSIGYELRKHRVAVKLSLDPSAPRLLADLVQLQQVFLNIFINAMEAMAQAKHRNLAISTAARGEEIRVTIEDSGGGIEGGAGKDLPALLYHQAVRHGAWPGHLPLDRRDAWPRTESRFGIRRRLFPSCHAEAGVEYAKRRRTHCVCRR